MIPAIRSTSKHHTIYRTFVRDLKSLGFAGEACLDYANRTVLSTDNSIYQWLPHGVLYPKDVNDLQILTSLSHEPEYCEVTLSPRGGGTGTNGQSLSDGLIVDTSRHMNQILEINAKEGWARVQCGVVKDQLNAAIKPYGLFFAPELSTSNRATIGGMINTDASGQGSCLYGKTRDHVLELTTVLMDGSLLNTTPLDDKALKQAKQTPGTIGTIYKLIDQIDEQYHDEIKATFPPLNRCLTGYDLAHIRNPKNQFDLNSILCGSEGTLGFIAEAKLNLLPIPKTSALVNLSYTDFDTALRDAKAIMTAGPTSIETIDSRVLALAKGDSIWESVSEFFPETTQPLEGINLVEYTADSKEELQQKMRPLIDQLLKAQNNKSIAYSIAWDSDVKKIWAMRKKAVGLLGNIDGEARPMPFVEDTAVPPEYLADFIAEFRALLDSYNLQYGMFGHVDAGVLHVRPILDMKQPSDEQLVRVITDKVVALTQKYHGLLWGEHGKGLRSEYAPQFFGKLYPLLQQIKQTFDPNYQLNPGKIATPADTIPLLKIDEVPTRGQHDKLIDEDSWQTYSEGMFCNGNGACHNWDPNDAMCPSWKGTRLRTHTPKGRASLIREWLKQLSQKDRSAAQEADKLHRQSWLGTLIRLPWRIRHSIGKRMGRYDFSHEIYESMMGCLACKSCTGSCPVKVDVPEFRSKFLELYYGRYLRPLKDYFIASLESTLPAINSVGVLYNIFMGSTLIQTLLAKTLGLSDNPLLSRINFKQELANRQIKIASVTELNQLSAEQKIKSVVLVQDAFTRYFETQLVLDTIDLLIHLGFKPWIAPYLANGKPLHVHGFRKKFIQVARKTSKALKQLEKTGIPLIGIEPSMTLVYRSEYKIAVPDADRPHVQLLQEWLSQQSLKSIKPSKKQAFYLLPHCTEKTNVSTSNKQWQSVFTMLGHSLSIIDVGCCGMAGTYGHETQNLETSKKIYALSWQEVIKNPQYKQSLVASGFSCRSQVKRIDQQCLKSPIQVLLHNIKKQ